MIIENLLKASAFENVTMFCEGTDKETPETVAIYRSCHVGMATFDRARFDAKLHDGLLQAPSYRS